MARALARSKYIALGGFYRRMAARRGGLVANKALARKLATLFWRVMVKGLDFVERGVAQYEAEVLEAPHSAPTGSPARPANRPQSSRRRLTACSWRGAARPRKGPS